MGLLDSLFGRSAESISIKDVKNDQDNLSERLIKAVTLNDYDESIYLIKLGANLSYKNERSLTALHVASFRNKLAIVEKLLENGADINVQDKYGATPLITATIEGHTEIVKYLIKSNADIFIKDAKGRTALRIALEIEYFHENTDRSDICLELINKCDMDEWDEYYDEAEYALIRASEAGNMDIVTKLIRAGMFLDFQNAYGNGETALIASLREGHRDIAKILIKSGANVDIETDGIYTFSALSWAESHNYDDVIFELKKASKLH